MSERLQQRIQELEAKLAAAERDADALAEVLEATRAKLHPEVWPQTCDKIDAILAAYRARKGEK